MKNILKVFVATAFASIFMACSADLLDQTPYDSISSESMWTNENLVDMGVTGVYSCLRYDWGGNYPNNYEQFAATCMPRNSAHALLIGNCTPSNGSFSGLWKQMYEGIARANDAIANIEKADMDDDDKARLIAECKFLRAYFYYRLNVLFGGVPLYLEPTELEGYTKARNSKEEVWAAIITDLTDAINESNLPGKYAAKDAKYGHITKGAAYALRGEVYLWTKDYSKAEADFKAIGPLGYGLFQGGYKQLFKEANEQCDEMIFTVQNIAMSGYGSEMTFKYGSRDSFGSCWNSFYPNSDFVDSIEYADGRPFDWDEIFPGYSSMTPTARAAYFLRDGMTTKEKESMQGKGADLSVYLDEGNEARVLKAYTGRDPRLTENVITPYSTYVGSVSAKDYTFTLRWPYRSDTDVSILDLRTDTNAYFYYLYRKFVAEGSSETPNRQYAGLDMPVIRYGSVLLYLAEALNEQGKTDEAITYVNMIRNRAGVAELNSNEYTQVTGQDNLRERIRKERRIELMGEGTTYFDELRWGTWEETKFQEGAGLKQVWGQMTQQYNYMGDYSYLWAIPKTECEMNGELDQNPGWIN